MIDIDLKENGHSICEYESPVFPQVDHFINMDIDTESYTCKGIYRVINVNHIVFTAKNEINIRSYVEIEVCRVDLIT